MSLPCPFRGPPANLSSVLVRRIHRCSQTNSLPQCRLVLGAHRIASIARRKLTPRVPARSRYTSRCQRCQQEAHSEGSDSLSARIALPALPAGSSHRGFRLAIGAHRVASVASKNLIPSVPAVLVSFALRALLTLASQEAHSEGGCQLKSDSRRNSNQVGGKSSPGVPARFWRTSNSQRSCQISHYERTGSAAATALNFSSFSSCSSCRYSRSSFSSSSRVLAQAATALKGCTCAKSEKSRGVGCGVG